MPSPAWFVQFLAAVKRERFSCSLWMAWPEMMLDASWGMRHTLSTEPCRIRLFLDGEDGNEVFVGRCEPLLGLDKSQCWSEPCGCGYVGAGYIGLGFQPGSHSCMAFGPELNLIWLGQSLLCVCSEEQGRAIQHTYPTDMPHVSTETSVWSHPDSSPLIFI